MYMGIFLIHRAGPLLHFDRKHEYDGMDEMKVLIEMINGFRFVQIQEMQSTFQLENK